ncbi:MAG: WecB/TagA/CpsF family glycosyltransferase [Flavobacterium sp.]|uniref:WecB/TagA/CpsF family glycosyltransferase n=1 Tax=Flavobacterium sp. TaxID=239 RepID=UPI002735DDF2|nr:WecB/TagA/CpsF family glycosyltransferase [Flavobacterium sp.]MDP3679584.1 WecB/TagA/CpsF family glycosyltransferase [Flavobacterium sp.]MDZ4330714.1 WecB/TagA/CpsF family glycosyltransferase [Flavobacterium sp.]
MIDSISSVPLLDYSIFSGDLADCARADKTLINTINQYSFCIAEEDAEFKSALQESDILLPDGVAIVAAVQLLNSQKIKKIAGAELHHFLLEDLNKKGGSCFYLGSSENTLLKITTRLSKDFPNIKVGAFSPPFKPEFSDEDNQQMVQEVNAFQPDVLFVGMTAPKQEKWNFQHKEKLEAKIICSIGAVFDFYAGTIVRPQPFWIRLHLEWFIRLVKEPKRMWKRYLYYGPIFIKLIVEKKIQNLF